MNEKQVNWLQQCFPYTRIEQLPVFGSVRAFYRLSGDGETRVVICDEDLNQLRLFVDRARLFASLNVKIPQIFEYSEDLNFVIEQDLGDESLEVIVNKNNTIDRLSYYRKVIDILVGWQRRFDGLPELLTKHALPVYDFDFAYNESMLFVSRYLEEFTYMTDAQIATLKPQFVDLAMKASSIKKTLIHRDFQARNIMWHSGEPYIVDFQACMMGPYTYDLAALVYDNHVDLNTGEKQNLIDYFFENYPEAKREDFYPVALQRILQAVSAYGYLSRQPGKKMYEKYLPKGLEHLKKLGVRFGWEGEIFDKIYEY